MKDLYLVGLGISGARQLTIEARIALKQCRTIFHIDENDRQLNRLTGNIVDLGPLYWTGENRRIVYRRIKDRVVFELSGGPGVALVTYGHPLFFDDVAHALLRHCKRRSLSVEVIAGISCLDTLSIDLSIDYGEGLQVYDATDLVLNKHKLNPRVHTLLLQLAEYKFDRTTDAIDTAEPNRYGSLVKYLLKYYPETHRVLIVQSDDGKSKRRFSIKLQKLNEQRRLIAPGVTLYLPPIKF